MRPSGPIGATPANQAEVERSGNGLPYFAMAQRQMAPYLDRLQTFTEGEVAPGITAVPLPGHTPGHTGYRIESGAESLLIWGDITHVPEVQIPRPDVTVIYDVDPGQAEASRRRILAETATAGQLVAGMHIHFPGYAHVDPRRRRLPPAAGALAPGDVTSALVIPGFDPGMTRAVIDQLANPSRTAAAKNAVSSSLKLGLPARWPQMLGIGRSSPRRRNGNSAALSATRK